MAEKRNGVITLAEGGVIEEGSGVIIEVPEKPYNMKDCYNLNDVFIHPEFGVGHVIEVIPKTQTSGRYVFTGQSQIREYNNPALIRVDFSSHSTDSPNLAERPSGKRGAITQVRGPITTVGDSNTEGGMVRLLIHNAT